jgi:hypothetical protein
MFCSTCGNQVNPDLRYCNSCGTPINRESEAAPGNQMSESSFNVLVGAILSLPIVGIGLIMGLLMLMKKEVGFSDTVIMGFAVMAFFLLIVSEAGLIVLLLNRVRVPKKKRADRPDETPREIPDVVMRGLNEGQQRSARDVISSVTEHTTRTLDAIPREKQ